MNKVRTISYYWVLPIPMANTNTNASEALYSFLIKYKHLWYIALACPYSIYLNDHVHLTSVCLSNLGIGTG